MDPTSLYLLLEVTTNLSNNATLLSCAANLKFEQKSTMLFLLDIFLLLVLKNNTKGYTEM